MGETDYGIDDFRIIQLLYEQKQCVYRRLQYLQERNLLPQEQISNFENYQSVVRNCQSMRMIYLKQLKKEGALEDPVKRITDERTRCKLADAIRAMMQKEEEILRLLAVL